MRDILTVNKLVWVLLIIAMLTLAGCGGSGGGGYQFQPPIKPAAPTPIWVSQSTGLVNATITVSSGSYYDQPFQVVSSMTNARVTGSFTASGGSGNDIETLILNNMAFTNWVNKHQVETLYNSGRITVANIDTSLATPGTYHLVFSNTFSTMSSKKVTTRVNLNWSELRYP